MNAKQILLAASTAVIAGMLATAAQAGGASSVAVYVGYADGLRSGADFPSPFSLGGSFTAGGNSYTIADMVANLSGTPDTGAVMLLNTGSTAITINNLDVNDRATGNDYQIWTGNGAGQLGSGVVLLAGQGAIFAENNGNNFDASDYSGAAGQAAANTGTTFDPNTNNCSIGPASLDSACTSVAPLVTFTLDGSSTTFTDSAHVLDTGGFDSAGVNHNHSDGTVSENESLQWRAIGTTGIDNPGGVPEPASWALMLLGFGALGAALRRRRQAALVA